MFYVKWEGFLSHIGSVVVRGLSLLNHYVGFLAHMLHPLCLRIWNVDPSGAGVFKHLGRGWNWMKTKTEMHKRQSCLWESFQVKAGNQKKANGISSGGNTGKKKSARAAEINTFLIHFNYMQGNLETSFKCLQNILAKLYFVKCL